MTTVSMHSALRAGLPKLAIATLLGLLAGPSWTQVPVDAEGNVIEAEPVGEALDAQGEAVAPAGENLTAEALEELVGPIALYPDDLLAVVLPASAYPLQIVQAARFLEERAQNADLQPDESWDDSVVALLNYPEVIQMMNEDLDWTYALGEAVVRQQADVIAAIEAFRDRAYAAGNLKTDERQTVTRDNGVIEIAPADEEVIYVPYYEPERVVVYQPDPVYYYYPRPCPVYYYPYPYGYSFASGYFWGVTTAFHIGWMTDHLHVFHNSYWGHPYFGHTYFFDRWWYRQPNIRVHNTFYVNGHVDRPPHHERDGDFWRPRRHSGAALDRRVYREAYYANSRGRTGTDFRRTRQILGDGTHADRNDNELSSRTRAGGDADRSARFARNRSGAAAGNRERTREAVSERRRATDAAPDRDVIRFRPRERADVVRRVPDSDDIRFRPRERADADVSRRAPTRERAGDRTIERSTTRRESLSIQREAPSMRRESAPAQRVTPSHSVERARISRPSTSVSRPSPSISRPSSLSRSSPSISRPSSVSRPSPSISRPTSGSRSSPSISRPSSGSRSSHGVSRPSSSSSHSSSSRTTTTSGSHRSHDRH